jgi:predicted nucleic acid-binding protein
LIVIDASACADLLLLRPLAPRLERRLLAEPMIHAPHLLDLEVAHVVRRYASRRFINATRGAEALDDLGSLPILRHPHYPFLFRIWELRNNLSAYDATYVALAEALGAPLITCDRRIALAPGHDARVEVFEE